VVLALALGVAASAAAAATAVTITRTIVLDRSIAGVNLGETRARIERRIGAGSGIRCDVLSCTHGYPAQGSRKGNANGTSFLIDPVRKKVVRIVAAAGR
jgi:hypothetical protein